ncbi:conserved phage C-terminal domain-containing protein [Lactobacillaceae bacterium 24-114]
MVRIRKDRSNHVTILDQALVRDDRLSWKARGIFAYLWSQSDNWDFNEREVAKHSTDGRDSLRRGLKELECYGYLERNQLNDKKGKFDGYSWTLHEKPRSENPTSENPRLGNPTQRYHQEKITSKEDNIKESNSQAVPDETPQLRKQIIDYLNEKLGTSYKPNASKNKTVINARLKEGYKFGDFKKVVDNKYADWANDEKMIKYLRPETLFGTKFDGYLNEQSRSNPVKKKRVYW